MRTVFLVVFMLSAFVSFGQSPNPVKWTFSGKKGNNPNEYILVASAHIQEGFHVFSPQPGGDGLLIPTEITISNKQSLTKTGSLIPQRRPVTKEMTGVGMVNYYEGDIDFTIRVEASKAPILEGILTFQCCNEQMCLPPTDVPFKVKL